MRDVSLREFRRESVRECRPCGITLRPDEKIGTRMGDPGGFFCSDPNCPLMKRRAPVEPLSSSVCGFFRRWFFGQPRPPRCVSHGGQPPMPRPPEDRGKPA